MYYPQILVYEHPLRMYSCAHLNQSFKLSRRKIAAL